MSLKCVNYTIICPNIKMCELMTLILEYFFQIDTKMKLLERLCNKTSQHSKL